MPAQKDIGTVGKSKWTAIITRGPLLILTDPHIHRTASPSASAFFITMAMPTTDINTTAEASTITVEAEECMEKWSSWPQMIKAHEKRTGKTGCTRSIASHMRPQFQRRKAMKKILLLLTIFTFILVGCTQHTGPKEGVGTLLGATGGAILGSNIGGGKGNIAAIAIGTLAGAFFGQEIGRSLDRADQIAMDRMHSIHWNIPVVTKQPGGTIPIQATAVL